MNKTTNEFDELLGTYPDHVRDIALETRQMIMATIPGLQEMVDKSARVIGYGFGAGYTDLICTIILSKNGVKLGLSGGAELPDPNGLLEGAGKRHRYVAFAEPSDSRKPGVKSLLKAGVAAWKKRSKARRS